MSTRIDRLVQQAHEAEAKIGLAQSVFIFNIWSELPSIACEAIASRTRAATAWCVLARAYEKDNERLRAIIEADEKADAITKEGS